MLSLCVCRLTILDLAVPWPACRFEPTCRLLKCHPFHLEGMGPVK